MTITVSFEELESYEAQCRNWFTARVVHAEKTVHVREDYANATRIGSLNLPAIQDWDKQHPFPKLIPSI